jgi:hypothetical protein
MGSSIDDIILSIETAWKKCQQFSAIEEITNLTELVSRYRNRIETYTQLEQHIHKNIEKFIF